MSRVVDQLRCALKAKNVIIEQLEEEKRDAVSEATCQLELKISELAARLRELDTAAPRDVSSLQSSAVTVVNNHVCNILILFAHRRMIAERGGCFQQRLFVCLSVFFI